jgi:hypothetical protein
MCMIKNKCLLCKGKGIKYTESIHKYKRKNGTIQLLDLGYWEVCLCNQKHNEKNLKRTNSKYLTSNLCH